jgi:hypothetical protein
MVFSNTFRDKKEISGGLVIEKGVWSAGGDLSGTISPYSGSPVISEIVAFGVDGVQGPLPPQLVYEESVTAASNVATLQFNAAHVMYVSNDTKAYIIVDKGTTPGAGEVAIDFTPATGTTKLTFASADSNPTVKVTYWPALSNKLLIDNLVESDVVDATPATGHSSRSGEVITITGGAAAIITVDVDGTAFKPLIFDDTPGSGEYKVTFDSSGDSVLTGSGTEFSTATSIKITFIKNPGKFNYAVDETAASSDVVTITSAFYLLRTSCYLYTDDNDVPHVIRNASATLAANQVSFNPRAVAGAKFTYEAATDVVASGIPYVQMLPIEIERAHVRAKATLSAQNAITVSCDGSDSGTYFIIGRAS